jgi:hypothetical protein
MTERIVVLGSYEYIHLFHSERVIQTGTESELSLQRWAMLKKWHKKFTYKKTFTNSS